jgi:phytoene desaturase
MFSTPDLGGDDPVDEWTAATRDAGPEPLAGESVSVVGAGFGGLSAAAHLAAAGADVTVHERRESVGGVAGQIEREGYAFDTGPTWYLLPETFERVFGRFGSEPSDRYDLTHLDPHYRVFWKDGDRADVPADPDAVRDLFEAREPGAAAALDRYLERAEESYELGMERFVRRDRSRLRDMLDTDVLRSGRALPLLRSMDEFVAGYFDDPKLRQLVQYTLVFLGGAPHNTPALYCLMSYVDVELGVYYPDGGMRTVAESVADLAREQGATIETDAPVQAIDPRGRGVDLTVDGRRRTADRVVSAAPPSHVERDLLPRGVADRDDYWAERTYAPSAFMLYLGVEGELPEFEHHTLVLPTDWDDHFRAVFEDPEWPADPAYYCCVPSRTDDAVAPDDGEAVVILVPIAPGLDDDADTRERYRDWILGDLAEHTGVDLRDRIVVEERACVSEFRRRFNAPRGTALGMAHTLRQTGPLRPGRRAPDADGLYYAGAYANPGVGVPMCLLSGGQAAAAAVRDAT